MTEPVLTSPDGLGVRSVLADVLGVRLVSLAGRTVFPETVAGRLSILIFHRILTEPDPLLPEEITAREFWQDMQMLGKHFNVLPLSEGLRRLKEDSLPPYSLCLTFDDGYRDNYTVAFPILKRLGLPATFFVATGYLDGGRMWNDSLREILRSWPEDVIDLSDWGIPVLGMHTLEDRRKHWKMLFRWMRRIGMAGRGELIGHLAAQLNRPLPDDLMLESEHVRELHRAGMEIGCHTDSHPILKRIDDRCAEDEIVRSRTALETLIQAPVRYFAYPNGVPGDDYEIRHARIVERCGFEAAFSTAWGVASPDSDRFQLPRFTPWDKTSARFALRFILSRRQTSYRLAA